MQKGWFCMQNESTPPITVEAAKDGSAPRRKRGRPKGSKDKKPRKKYVPLSAVHEHVTAELEKETDEGAAWAERGRYWEGPTSEPSIPPRSLRKRKVERKPLVLNGHGVRLRIHQGALIVQNGFTYYPQERQELRLFPGDRRLPSRIVLLDSDGSISIGVIKWLSAQQVPLVLLNWQGEVVSVMGEGTAYEPALREAQLAAQRSEVGLQISLRLIQDKVIASQVALRTLPRSYGREVALFKLDLMLEELKITPPQSVEELLLIEARAAHTYFTCWQLLPLKWKGTGRKPILPEWKYVRMRRSMLGGNRHATHPVNAMLNYAYAVLESQVRIAIVSQGLDPTIGYLHVCRPGRVVLVYDLMEPLRPQVDRLVLNFMRSHTFAPSDFVLGTNGVCRLHSQLARQVTQLAVNDALVQEVLSQLVGKFRNTTG